MALSREMLKAMGIEEEKIDQIIEQHVETVDALKHQRDTYRDEAEKVPGLEKKIQELEASENDGYREKYEEEHQAFEDFKADVEKQRSNEQRRTLYRNLLADSGIADKRIDTVLKVADLGILEIDENGNVTNAEDVKAKITEEWADLIPAEAQRGANVDTPPTTSAGGMTKEQILAIKNPVQRQQAMAENPSEFPELAGLS